MGLSASRPAVSASAARRRKVFALLLRTHSLVRPSPCSFARPFPDCRRRRRRRRPFIRIIEIVKGRRKLVEERPCDRCSNVNVTKKALEAVDADRIADATEKFFLLETSIGC